MREKRGGGERNKIEKETGGGLGGERSGGTEE